MRKGKLFLVIFVLFQKNLVKSNDDKGYDDWLLKMAEYEKISKVYGEDNKGIDDERTRMTGIGDFNLTFQCTTSVSGDKAKLQHFASKNTIDNTIQISRNILYQLSKAKPISVHQLRPSDIDVVAAIGDSITAGSGAKARTMREILRADRGVAWSMGGGGNLSTSVTLPNILRKYRPDLNGYSLGRTPPDYDLIWFNEAIPGARAKHMPNQAQDLIDRMKNDSRINFEEDWKIISLFIGGNDLCAVDYDIDSSAEKYIQYIQEALDLLHQEIPRVLVNFVVVMEMLVMREVGFGSGGTEACRDAQAAYCPYVFSSNETELAKIEEINHKYQELSWELINSGRYDTKDDFTVVIQPFLHHTVLPLTDEGEVDTSFFAPDCLHFNTKGHALGAINLWNNMFEPVGNKSMSWSISELRCPNEEAPYIYTNLNSMFSTNETTISLTSTVVSTEQFTSKPIQEPITTTSGVAKQHQYCFKIEALSLLLTYLSTVMFLRK